MAMKTYSNPLPSKTGKVYVKISWAVRDGVGVFVQPSDSVSTRFKLDWGAVHFDQWLQPNTRVSGFVVRMDHNQADSITLTITTNGSVNPFLFGPSTNPGQGKEPQEFSGGFKTADCYDLVTANGVLQLKPVR